MSVLLDEETVVLDGLDFDVPCVHEDEPAEFFVKCRGCDDNAGHLCGRHLAAARRRVTELGLNPFVQPRCAVCLRETASFDDAYVVVPL